MQPLVSIIIPTYNRAHHISETLDSVLAQTYSNWECIIVDDGSTDNTDEVVQEYLNKDSRFKYHQRPEERPKGANACRNYGFEVSEGKYINWLDSDDLFSENKLEEQLKIIDLENPDIVICKWGLFSGNQRKVYESLLVYKDYNEPFLFFKDLYAELGYFVPHVYLVKSCLVKKVSPWNEYLHINQDAVFFTSLIQSSRKICFAEKATCFYRHTRDDSVSRMTNEKIDQFISTIKWIEESHKIRFNGNIPKEFSNYKWKAYLRIPRSYYKQLKKGGYYFKQEMQKQAKMEPFRKKIKLLIKNLLNIKNA